MISKPRALDHVQGHAAMKKLTGAQVVALGGDLPRWKLVRTFGGGGFPA